jgi:hypothetical protein
MRTLPSELAHHFANVDYRRRLALVADRLEGEVPAVIGVARLEPMANDRGSSYLLTAIEVTRHRPLSE